MNRLHLPATFSRCGAYTLTGVMLGVLALAACGPKTGPVDFTKSIDKPGRFQAVLKEHTRNAQIWEWSFRHANVYAALVTPRLRSAFIADRLSYHGKAAERVADDLVNMGKAPDEGMDAPMAKTPVSEDEIVVYVSLYTPDSSFRYLGRNYTAWDVVLRRGDERIQPTKVESRDNDEALAAVFPFVDRYDNFYTLRFPLISNAGTPLLAPGGEPLELLMQSTLGEMKVAWTLTPPALDGSGGSATADGQATSAADSDQQVDAERAAETPTESAPTDAVDIDGTTTASSDDESASADDASSDDAAALDGPAPAATATP